MPSYTVNEPHPTVPANTYTHSGRGGAGNMFRAPATTSPSGVSMPVAPSKTSTKRFYSGRGGAGNAHAATERPVLSFEEEYASAAAREKHTAGHVGRGGAGNIFSSGSSADGSSRRDSSSTHGSERSGFWGRLSGSHSH